MKPPETHQQDGGLPLSTSDLLAVAEWLTGRDTGVSSKYMASVAISGKVTKSDWLDPTPSDAPDLGRCVRLIEKAPTVRNCFPILRQASSVWHQGDYHITTGRMRDLRSSANDKNQTPPPRA
jgi:hypothetical protein